ncbi:2-hydroxy-acid oxidase [Erysipelotrichaceae bacterium NYU-BL-E8]|uniref:2-hydroxy-acid oxidase n=1 Tax=Ileibacterium valens TaxID=1862668 RepID=A0A1U7NHM0_9FIRM|nr:2-hydroxy-acid oxidase [Erysipelotrichaceae bacterium NYU-BL-E8]OLU40637.1 2-hydroxy-acid oxidase [Erysipelotrichaceae bacterium NYU-BL-F16]OLU41409.1 2-hydroxy-acid oxidase [Ileibacterium valens]
MIIPENDRLIIGAENIERRWSENHQHQLTENARAEILAFPIIAEEVSELLRWASRYNVPVTPRGAGTNLTGSTVPLYGGLVIDLSRMNHILCLDEDTMTLSVEPGVLLEDVQDYVSQRGYFYPPDPGEKKSTIGGNIATNAGGMRAVRYGVTRDYVRKLQVVFADGTISELGSSTIKDASGLSLKESLIGSEGTLGIITRADLKILNSPEFSRSVLLAFSDLEQAGKNVLEILSSSLNPTAIEFMNRTVVQLGEQFLNFAYPFETAGSYLLLTFDGSENVVREQLDLLKDLAEENGAIGLEVLDDPKRAARIWQVRGALCTAVEATSMQEPIDIVVPIDKICRFVRFVEDLEKRSQLQMVSFGHAGDGNIHLCIVRGQLDEDEWEEKLALVLQTLYDEAYACGGLASGEHGIGLQKRKYFLAHSDPSVIALMNGIKNAFDPAHILNKGKSYVIEQERNIYA